jgi:hypothetical protein
MPLAKPELLIANITSLRWLEEISFTDKWTLVYAYLINNTKKIFWKRSLFSDKVVHCTFVIYEMYFIFVKSCVRTYIQ